jgi:hypothetical protein
MASPASLAATHNQAAIIVSGHRQRARVRATASHSTTLESSTRWPATPHTRSQWRRDRCTRAPKRSKEEDVAINDLARCLGPNGPQSTELCLSLARQPPVPGTVYLCLYLQSTGEMATQRPWFQKKAVLIINASAAKPLHAHLATAATPCQHIDEPIVPANAQ